MKIWRQQPDHSSSHSSGFLVGAQKPPQTGMLKMPEILCKRHWKWPDLKTAGSNPFWDSTECWSVGSSLTLVHVSNVKMLPKAVSPSLDFSWQLEPMPWTCQSVQYIPHPAFVEQSARFPRSTSSRWIWTNSFLCPSLICKYQKRSPWPTKVV